MTEEPALLPLICLNGFKSSQLPDNIFPPFALYQSVNLLTSPSLSPDLRQAGFTDVFIEHSSYEECRSEGNQEGQLF